MNNNPPLTDDSPFPFGANEGIPMKKVPVSYLNFLWQRGLKWKSNNLVADYIRAKIPEWTTEYPGFNWGNRK